MLPPKAAELSLPPVVASSSSGGVIVVLPENVEHGTHVTTTLPLLVSESRVFDYEFSGMESGKRDHDSVGTHSRRVTLWWVGVADGPGIAGGAGIAGGLGVAGSFG